MNIHRVHVHQQFMIIIALVDFYARSILQAQFLIFMIALHLGYTTENPQKHLLLINLWLVMAHVVSITLSQIPSI